jgi:hypothetical protein
MIVQQTFNTDAPNNERNNAMMRDFLPAPDGPVKSKWGRSPLRPIDISRSFNDGWTSNFSSVVGLYLSTHITPWRSVMVVVVVVVAVVDGDGDEAIVGGGGWLQVVEGENGNGDESEKQNDEVATWKKAPKQTLHCTEPITVVVEETEEVYCIVLKDQWKNHLLEHRRVVGGGDGGGGGGV